MGAGRERGAFTARHVTSPLDLAMPTYHHLLSNATVVAFCFSLALYLLGRQGCRMKFVCRICGTTEPTTQSADDQIVDGHTAQSFVPWPFFPHLFVDSMPTQPSVFCQRALPCNLFMLAICPKLSLGQCVRTKEIPSAKSGGYREI